jgi:hypothetical protein
MKVEATTTHHLKPPRSSRIGPSKSAGANTVIQSAYVAQKHATNVYNGFHGFSLSRLSLFPVATTQPKFAPVF